MTGPININKVNDFIEDCSDAYDRISHYEKGNFFVVDRTTNRLELRRENQSSAITVLTKTLSNISADLGLSSVRSDWRTISKKIREINEEMQQIIEYAERDKHILNNIKLKNLDVILLQAHKNLIKYKEWYHENTIDRIFNKDDKIQAAEEFSKIAQRTDLLQKKLHNLYVKPDEKVRKEEKGFESLVIDEDVEDAHLEQLERKDILNDQISSEKENKTREFILPYSSYSQLENMRNEIAAIPEMIPLYRLQLWAQDASRELKTHNLDPIKANALNAFLKEISKTIQERQKALQNFESELKTIDKTKLNDFAKLLNNLDRNIINEEKVSQLLKLHLDLSSISIDQLKNELKNFTRGVELLIYYSLNDHLSQSYKHLDDDEYFNTIEKLSEALLRIDTYLSDNNQNEHRFTTVQSALAIAYHQLIAYHIKNENESSVFSCLEKIKDMKILPAHSLGDLQRLGQKANQNSFCVQVDGSFIRRRMVRVQNKNFQNPTHKFLSLSFSLPAIERQELSNHFEFLLNSNLLQRYKIKMMSSNIFLPEKDSTTGAYKGLEDQKRKAVYLGKALTFMDNTQKIQVTFGRDIEKWNQYQKVSIQLDPSVTSQELYEFLSVIGLQTAMMTSRPEDIANENMARLACAKNPLLSLSSGPNEVLQKIESDDDIKLHAKEMRVMDVGNGRLEYIDPNAIDEFWLAGGRGFGATLGHVGVDLKQLLFFQSPYEISPIEKSAMHLGYILKGGMLSTMNRFEEGILGSGNAPEENIQTGSANQVFVRPLTDNQFDTYFDWSKFAIEGNIFLLMDSRLAGRLPYGYPTDRAGLRNPNHNSTKVIRMAQKEFPELGLRGELMNERKTLNELCKSQRMTNQILPTAEVMLEEVVGKEFIYGAIVKNPSDKEMVIKYLKSIGIDNIQGVPLEKAIFIGNFNKMMIKNIYL